MSTCIGVDQFFFWKKSSAYERAERRSIGCVFALSILWPRIVFPRPNERGSVRHPLARSEHARELVPKTSRIRYSSYGIIALNSLLEGRLWLSCIPTSYCFDNILVQIGVYFRANQRCLDKRFTHEAMISLWHTTIASTVSS